MRQKMMTALLACCAALAAWSQDFSPEQMEKVRKLLVAEGNIVRYYVDQVDESKIVEEAIRGMLKELDPHSTYSNAEEVKRLNASLQGNFDGIGIRFNMVNDTLYVVQPTVGGPCDKAGIVAGDRIVAVNDTAIAGVKMSNDVIMSRLRGPKGTTVKLTVLRHDTPDPIDYHVTRDKIVTHSLDASFMVQPGVGYIRLGSFGATTHQEFVEALAALQKQKMETLVLDLQGNGGGYLRAAVDIADEFLPGGRGIVYTEGRTQPRYDYTSTHSGRFKEGKLIVLIDEQSASAAEILTGAIQDWDRGMVVGRRSFGKGLVQRPVYLPDGSMIRLTVSRYYTPTGRSIQRPYDDKKEYAAELMNRYNRGELMNEDSIHFPDSLRFTTLRSRRTVYGGGGIMPDHFVPLDTTAYTKYHRALAAKGSTTKAALRYIEEHRKELKKYRTANDYVKNFAVDDAFIELVKQQGVRDGVELPDDEELAATLPLLKRQMKALVAHSLWEMNEYHMVMCESNEILQQALKLLDSPLWQQLGK